MKYELHERIKWLFLMIASVLIGSSGIVHAQSYSPAELWKG